MSPPNGKTPSRQAKGPTTNLDNLTITSRCKETNDPRSLRQLCSWGALVDAVGSHRWTEADEREWQAMIERISHRGAAA